MYLVRNYNKRYQEHLKKLLRANDISAEDQRILHTLPPRDESKGLFRDIVPCYNKKVSFNKKLKLCFISKSGISQ